MEGQQKSSLKKNTIVSMIWNAVDKVGFQVVALMVGIITARLLSERDFGLIGALSVFTLIANILVESGFSSALIRRKENTDEEYSAVFVFNLGLSVLIYALLFFSAPLLASFYEMPELTDLARLLFLAIVLNSLGIVQIAIYTRNLEFSKLTKINLAAGVVAGVVTVWLSVKGYGYWALAWQQILQVGVKTLLLWVCSSWRMTSCNFAVLKELFSFSIFIMFTSFLSNFSRSVYNMVIGKVYQAERLGFYTQANKYQQILVNIITSTLSGVAYPVLSSLREEPGRQLMYFRKIMRIASFLICPTMLGMFVLAEEFVIIVLTDKWLPIVPYFKILLVAGVLAPFHTLNGQMLLTNGYSNVYFKTEVVRSVFTLLSLLLITISIEALLYGYLGATVISYLYDNYVIQKHCSYKITHQHKDIFPYIVVSCFMLFAIEIMDYYANIGNIYLQAVIKLIAGAALYLLPLKLLGSAVLKDMLELLRGKGSV
jgi:O-antigen/teichoic acid export membrane protein